MDAATSPFHNRWDWLRRSRLTVNAAVQTRDLVHDIVALITNSDETMILSDGFHRRSEGVSFVDLGDQADDDVICDRDARLYSPTHRPNVFRSFGRNYEELFQNCELDFSHPTDIRLREQPSC